MAGLKAKSLCWWEQERVQLLWAEQSHKLNAAGCMEHMLCPLRK
jgi:hypothetical protein